MKDIDERISVIAKACDDRNGFDVKILDLRELTTVTDYFVIVSANSTTQVKAIADGIEEEMEKLDYTISKKEGYQGARWTLLDYGDIVAHIFHKDEREFYNLEKLWADSKELKL